jgi:hypothetical protein
VAVRRVVLRIAPARRARIEDGAGLRWIVAVMVVRPSLRSYTESEEASASEA